MHLSGIENLHSRHSSWSGFFHHKGNFGAGIKGSGKNHIITDDYLITRNTFEPPAGEAGMGAFECAETRRGTDTQQL
jgi:hypothetical protein